jgi:hypothetical protein
MTKIIVDGKEIKRRIDGYARKPEPLGILDPEAAE